MVLKNREGIEFPIFTYRREEHEGHKFIYSTIYRENKLEETMYFLRREHPIYLEWDINLLLRKGFKRTLMHDGRIEIPWL